MERHAKSLKSPLKTCSFAPRISRIYPSAKGDEDLIPWVGIIGVAFCQKILRFTICAVFFFHWDLEESGDSGLPVACWDTQLPKGKIHFFRQRNPRSSQDSSATIASPTAFVTTRCQGEISGSKSTGRKVVSKQRWTFKMRIFLPPCGFITIQNPLVLVTMSEITWKMALSTKAKDTCLCSKHDLLEEE